ncbi:MAG: hypothetical protein JW757_07320 [Anaerolineales bacterium]|nr:hypothetical protein [Anaerolineales bacterium]
MKIGNQWWMSENLRVATNRSGEQIARRCYQNDEANCEVYGGLYTWDIAMDGTNQEGAQGLCPDGWHIPTDAEWIVLFDYLGGVEVASGHLKTTGTEIWVEPNACATNISGFNALPAGGGFPDGGYEGLGFGVHMWSSTENGDKAGMPTVHFEGADVWLLNESKELAITVRCVMDP